MRFMRRNLVDIYYRTYVEDRARTDTEGYETGEREIVYSDPVALSCNVSSATGESSAALFGTDERYDLIIMTDDTTCPIDENSLLYVDVDVSGQHDYMVKRVAKTLNHRIYAARKVT